ncbi:glutamyl-tRNA(Gln) amidotransferase subunit A, putative [Plasmodium ovale]|uniref:Glutamyl-tRNA(Gln) amidotransferase subunit A, putative n=1 Tax=Plasmodium ovale TaxID=36330 RepID=A0A1C3KI88_PLAOA|nr:glutamyl-tRNA(Gln) amidotransferase subunit A, putative [Plasmodium ovale]
MYSLPVKLYFSFFLLNFDLINIFQSVCLIQCAKVIRAKESSLSDGIIRVKKCKQAKHVRLPLFYILSKKSFRRTKKEKRKCIYNMPDKSNYGELKSSHIYQIRKEILSKSSIKDVIEKHIINKVLHENINKYNSFSYIYNDEEIYEQVRNLHKIYEQCNKLGKLPKLFGLPIVLKDNIIAKNIPTKAGSEILSNYRGSYDSTVVKKLKKYGAVIIGKTHLDEFAMGSCTGKVKNPFNEKYLSCGGSSGGSASCVGSKIMNCSVNTDTGGSIRTPAALCGCIGLKPTYGRISRYGIVPYNEETDVVGLIVNNVYDCSVLLDVLCGKDKNDLTTLKKEKKKKFFFSLKKYEHSEEFKSDVPLKGVHFGYLSEDLLRNYFVDDIVCKNYTEVMKNIERLGGVLVNTNVHKLIDYCYVYYLYSMTIVSSNISRINGINYNIPNVKDENNFVRKLRSCLIGENVLTRIIGGSIISSHFQKINLYHMFLYIKEKLTRKLENIFKEVNYILLPSLPRSDNLREDIDSNLSVHNIHLPNGNVDGGNFVKNGWRSKNAENNLYALERSRGKHNICRKNNMYNKYMKEVFSVVSSISGFPSIVIPTGEFTKGFNEPQSFQVVTANMNELGLLKVALVYKDRMDINRKMLENLRNRKNSACDGKGLSSISNHLGEPRKR